MCFNLTFPSDEDLVAIAAGISGDSGEVDEAADDPIGAVATTFTR